MKTILYPLAEQLINLWCAELRDEYHIYIQAFPAIILEGEPHTLDITGEHYLFHSCAPIPETVIEHASRSRKIALFNKEIVYYYTVSNHNGTIVISVDMSSMIYGRSRVHIADVEYSRNEDQWIISASRYARASEADGFKGTIKECCLRIVDIEMQLGSPYDSMRRSYYDKYQDAMDRMLEIAIDPDGIRFNNYFGI
jgi:hypothetical protein